MSNDDPEVELVRQHVDALMEHYDTVQIFCTRHNSQKSSTTRVCHGEGNWFARYGQVKSWIIIEEQADRNTLGEIE